MRTYLIDHVRKHASLILSIGSQPEWHYTNYDRSTAPELVDLLRNPKKPNEDYPTYPRVLFTNYTVVEKELFGSAAIANVFYCHSPLISPY